MPDYTPTPEEEKLLREYYPDQAGRESAVLRLAAGEPMAYIIGEQAFFGEIYTVRPGVLIPRFDTERVVEKVIALLPEGGHFADLCTGSGCIAISTLVHRPDATADAYELSDAALRCARENAERLDVTERLTLRRADVTDPALYETLGGCDLIVSNPPYIPTAECAALDDSVKHEPLMALDGGEDGMRFYRAILSGMTGAGLRIPVVFEIGYDRADAIGALADEFGAAAKLYRDWGGNWRTAVIEFK
ncbi:MAG: peptide chain release factor N(5)-glutamine methyltransferase [Clostridiales bacterium]|nr:peptide chain release factor N(5)-glutamine methyltransferase [Clostridiales bacterium]